MTSSKMRVVVLGCGPAGLVAAHAASGLGHEVIIASNTWEPSVLHGCQYLHAPIPGYLDVPKTSVTYRLRGSVGQYRRKVYGDTWKRTVSPEDFIGEHDAWDIRETYRRMWGDVAKMVPKRMLIDVTGGDLAMVRSLGADKIISTIPAVCLCHSAHLFTGHDIYATGTTESAESLSDYVVCDGTATSWYRISNVFGYRTVEWPENGYHGPEAVRVSKPLTTDCTCNPDVVRVGRYGEWDKSVLVHQVYDKVVRALQ